MLVTIIGTFSCAKVEVVTGSVLAPGQRLEATNKFGNVSVSYVSPTRRKVELDGVIRLLDTIPREEKFEGKLGIYNPGAVKFFSFNETRIVFEESTINFDNYEQIRAFLKQSRQVMDWVYTKDGLVMGFSRDSVRRQVNIDIWQILISGNKPVDIQGSRENSIHLIFNRPKS